jgi:hypothetical protein
MSNTDQSWPCPQKFMLLSAVLHIGIKDSGRCVTKSLIDNLEFLHHKVLNLSDQVFVMHEHQLVWRMHQRESSFCLSSSASGIRAERPTS